MTLSTLDTSTSQQNDANADLLINITIWHQPIVHYAACQINPTPVVLQYISSTWYIQQTTQSSQIPLPIVYIYY